MRRRLAAGRRPDPGESPTSDPRALGARLRDGAECLAGAVLLVATAPALAPVAEPWPEVAAFVASASAPASAHPAPRAPGIRRAAREVARAPSRPALHRALRPYVRHVERQLN
jgi:hypothetical protein